MKWVVKSLLSIVNHDIIRREITTGGVKMKHIKTLNGASLKKDLKNIGCGECQTSCQSACKTSCTVANQACRKKN